MTTIGPHKVTCGSLISPAVDAMLAGERVNILYSDPPWGDGNLAYWQTMNRKMTGAIVPQVKHSELYDRILQLIARYVDGFVFVETGLRWRDYVMDRLRGAGLVNLSAHGLKYRSGSKQLENVLIAAGTSPAYQFNFNPSPYRGAELPRHVVASVATPGGIVFDPCCGMGYSARAAVAAGMQFRGNELNRKRLDKTIAFLTAASS